MQKITLSLLAFAVIVVSCKTKKTVAAAPVTKTETTTSAASTPKPVMLVKPADGIYPPAEAELAAIQTKYKEVTLEHLNNGYKLYTGTCRGCHDAANIYTRPEETWPAIIDNMAERASLTPIEKDAVLKYVLAIKATQGK